MRAPRCRNAAVAGEPTEGAVPPAPKPAADPGSRFLLFAAIPSWLVSMVLHIVLLFALAFLTVPEPPKQREYEIQMGNTEDSPLEETLVVESPALDPQPTEEISDIAPSTPIEVQPTELITDAPPVLQPDNLEAAQATTELDPLGQDVAPTGDLLRQIGSYSGTGLEGRGQASRAARARRRGDSRQRGRGGLGAQMAQEPPEPGRKLEFSASRGQLPMSRSGYYRCRFQRRHGDGVAAVPGGGTHASRG